MDRLNKDHRGLTPELLLRAYAAGIFPMAEGRNEKTIFWVDPERRGVIPLDSFRVPRRLKRTVRQAPYDIRVDTAFEQVIQACAANVLTRKETWINDEIIRVYTELYKLGYAHSVECYDEGNFAGGLYGIALGGAFFGESMVSRARDASKIALVHLIARLKLGGYRLLDSQFITAHLTRFGAVEINRAQYLEKLGDAFAVEASFPIDPPADQLARALDGVLQSSTQTS
jgi:leucyl/phenylalanyl-tRNA--protein transferase